MDNAPAEAAVTEGTPVEEAAVEESAAGEVVIITVGVRRLDL